MKRHPSHQEGSSFKRKCDDGRRQREDDDDDAIDVVSFVEREKTSVAENEENKRESTAVRPTTMVSSSILGTDPSSAQVVFQSSPPRASTSAGAECGQYGSQQSSNPSEKVRDELMPPPPTPPSSPSSSSFPTDPYQFLRNHFSHRPSSPIRFLHPSSPPHGAPRVSLRQFRKSPTNMPPPPFPPPFNTMY